MRRIMLSDIKSARQCAVQVGLGCLCNQSDIIIPFALTIVLLQSPLIDPRLSPYSEAAAYLVKRVLRWLVSKHLCSSCGLMPDRFLCGILDGSRRADTRSTKDSLS